MAEVIRFPVRPSPRLASSDDHAVPQLAIDHSGRELREVAVRLHEATGHFGMLVREPVGKSAIREGCIALQAALFHALTLDGCSNETRELRQMLLTIHMKRMEAAGE